MGARSGQEGRIRRTSIIGKRVEVVAKSERRAEHVVYARYCTWVVGVTVMDDHSIKSVILQPAVSKLRTYDST